MVSTRLTTRSPMTRRVLPLLAATALALAACGSDGDDGASTEPATSDVTATDDEAAAATFPRTVTHALGTTKIETEPERVVALDRSVIDAALALGLDVVGYTTYSDPDGDLPAYFGEALDEHAADATWVGDLLSPNLEAIVALQPDLILTSAVRHEDIYDQLAGIAPTVATESAGGGWKDGFMLVAEAAGKTDEAEVLLTEYEDRAAEVGTAINETADAPTISVVRFLDQIRLYQPVSFSGVVLEDAGLARPESQQDTEEFIRVISEEELALADADVVLYSVYDNEAVETGVAEIQSRPLWNTLEAVQNDMAFPVLDDAWMSGVGLYGAHLILDDLESIFGISDEPTSSEQATDGDGASGDDGESGDTDPGGAAAAAGTISEVATAAGATFIPGYATHAPGYDEAINGHGPVTALMPSDDAFIAFSEAYPNLTGQLRADFDRQLTRLRTE